MIKKGRPTNIDADSEFTEIVKHLEDNTSVQITIKDLTNKMREHCREDVNSYFYLKKRLMDHFGCEIVISEINGKQHVVTFKIRQTQYCIHFTDSQKMLVQIRGKML